MTSDSTTIAESTTQKPRPAQPGQTRLTLTAQQRTEALRRIQAQADQRVTLGVQLFKAAEAHTTHQHDLLGRIKTDQQQVKQELQQDLAGVLKSIASYDQQLDRFENLFSAVMTAMAKRIDSIYNKQIEAEQRINETVKQVVDLLEKTQHLMDEARTAAANQVVEIVEDQAGDQTPPGQPYPSHPLSPQNAPRFGEPTPSGSSDFPENRSMIFAQALSRLHKTDASIPRSAPQANQVAHG